MTDVMDLGTINVTPDEEKGSNVPAHDKMAAARLQGHEWPDIHAFNKNFEGIAALNDYSKGEIDAYQGWPSNGPLLSRINDEWMKKFAADPALKQKVFEGETPNAKEFQGDDFQHQYAAALSEGHARSPQDFADSYLEATADAHGDVSDSAKAQFPKLAADLAKGLPALETFIDGALGVVAGRGAPMTPQNVSTAKNNLLDFWVQTGLKPQDVQNDPLMNDALAQRQALNGKTIEEQKEWEKEHLPPWLLQHGKEAVNDPMGNMITDPTGLVGTAQAIWDLPDQAATWREALEKLKAEGKGPGTPEYDEKWRENPALNFAVQTAFFGLTGKAANKGAAFVKPALEGGTLKELWKDQSGTVKIPPVFKDRGVLGREIPAKQQKAALNHALAQLGKAKPPKPPELSPKLMPSGIDPKTVREPVTALEYRMNQLGRQETADRIIMTKFTAKLPPEWQDNGFQQKVTETVDRRVEGRVRSEPADVSQFLDTVKELTDRRAALLDEIAQKTRGTNLDDPSYHGGDISIGEQHRIIKGQETGRTLADPGQQSQNPVSEAYRRKSLSTKTASLEPMHYYVMDNGKGIRQFRQEPLSNYWAQEPRATASGKFVKQTLNFGHVEIDGNGTTWTVKPASMREIEEGTKNSPNPVTFHKNFIASQIDDVVRLERVNRNLDFMEKAKADLRDEGLYWDDKSNTPRPADFAPINVPQMQGAWAHYKIANAINTFYQDNSLHGWDAKLAITNHFLTSAMFLSPITHIANVGAHWQMSRGWDWINPKGYGTLMRDGNEAFKEVISLGPRYIQYLKDGGGLQYGHTMTENFHEAMMQGLYGELQNNPTGWAKFAQQSGFNNVKDFVTNIYKGSRQVLWAANDMMMLQRYFEVERRLRGLGYAAGDDAALRQEVIRIVQKDIPPYDLPTEVLNSKFVGDTLRNPVLGPVFGRYHYGLASGIKDIVKDIVQGTPEHEGGGLGGRQAAIGKLVALGFGAMVAIPAINYAIQKFTGDSDDRFRAPGPYVFGQMAKDIYHGELSPIALLGPMLTFSPVMKLIDLMRTGHDDFGREVIQKGSTAKNQVLQSLEGAADQFWVTQQLHKMMKTGAGAIGGNLFNLQLHAPGTPTRDFWHNYNARAAARHDARDPVIQKFNQTFEQKYPNSGARN